MKRRLSCRWSFQGDLILLPLLLIVVLALGFSPYAGVDLGSARAAGWFVEAAPDFARTTADFVNVAASLPLWDALMATLALAAWRLGARAIGRALIQGLSIEVVAFIAKSIFLTPWILVHAMPVGGYVAARSVPAQATVQASAPPALRFSVDLPAGVYGVRVRLSGDRWGMNSVSMGLDDAPQPSAKGLFVLPDGWWRWGSTGSDGEEARLTVATPGRHIVNVWARAFGVRIDRVELRFATAPPTDAGTVSGDDREFTSLSTNRRTTIVVEAESFDSDIQPDASLWTRRTGPPDRFASRLLFTIRTADMPSAHVARVSTMLGLAIGFVPRPRRLLRACLTAGMILAVAAVACSRILSSAHTPIGSVAGCVLGLAWLQWLTQRQSFAADGGR